MKPEIEKRLGILSPDARRLFDLWLSLRDGALVPPQSRFDPTSVADLLGSMYIYRFDATTDEFICRLAGEAINRAWGGSIKGAALKQIVGRDRHAAALERWKAVITTPRVQYGRIDDIWEGVETCVAERLVLPMSGGGEPDRVLGFARYRYRQTDRERVPPVWEDVTTINCADL